MNWRVVFSIARKDLVDAIKNMYLLFTMVLPIGMSLMFQLMLPNEQEIGQVKIVIYDPAGSQLLAKLQAHVDIELISVANEQQVYDKLQADQEIGGGVIVPADFDAAFQAALAGTGAKPQVRAIVNGQASSLQQGIFRQALVDQTWQLVRSDFPVEMVWNDPSMVQGSQDNTNQGNEFFSLDSYLLLVVLIMGLAMIGAFVVPSLMVEEKEKHTLDALLVSPGGPAEVAAGKAIVGMVYSLLVGGILMAINDGFSGNWLFTVLAVVLGSLFVVALGLLMGSLFKVMHQVNIASSVVMLLLIIPSWVGIFTVPAVLNQLIRVIPTFYLGEVIKLSLAGNATLANTWLNLAILAGSTVLVFVGIIWALRRDRV